MMDPELKNVLAEAVAFMKANKILHLQNRETTITLHPDALAEAPVDFKPEAPVGPNLDEPGRTGMTRRQQMELYGTVFEEDFKPVEG